MATLLELYTIEANSLKNPEVEVDADVLAAIDLLHKVRSAVMQHAADVLGTPLPTDDTRADALELLAWAQKAVVSPDAETARVLRFVLATNAAATTAQILAVTDATILSAIEPVLPFLAKGTR